MAPLRLFWARFAQRFSRPAVLSIAPTGGFPPPRRKAKPPSVPERFPGNFYSFPFYLKLTIGEQEQLGLPKVPVRDAVTKQVRWGTSVEWMYPTPSQTQILWADDPVYEVNCRTILRAEDLLGAEGKVGDMRLRFESILDYGKGVIVYALYAPDKGIRLAYGWNRDAVEPGYQYPIRSEDDVKKMLERTGESQARGPGDLSMNV